MTTQEEKNIAKIRHLFQQAKEQDAETEQVRRELNQNNVQGEDDGNE